MKLIITCCKSPNGTAHEDAFEGIAEPLASSGIEVQRLELPPLDGSDPLRSLVSWRLLPISGMADALLCLDACSALLRHPHKCVWVQYEHCVEPPTHDEYMANILSAGLREAKSLFATAAAMDAMKRKGLGTPRLLETEAAEPAKSRRRLAMPYKTLVRALSR